jgi:UPF0755 protein
MMQHTRNYTLFGMVLIIALIGVVYVYDEMVTIPSGFPINKNFTVNENESLKSVSGRLESEGYITSSLLFRASLSFFGKDRVLQLGGYAFPQPLPLLGVVTTFVQGHPSSPLLSVTIPEGSTSFEVAVIIAKAIPALSIETFTKIINEYKANGKLFPSTYFLLPSYKEEDIVKLMLSTFTKKVEPTINPSEIHSPLTSVNDVLVLASILEGEAKTEEDMKIVAGILLERLSKGMMLQVDAAKETYKQKGLPSTPINNPGLVAINAVLHPIETPYLFYLTGNDGKMYYAKTFEEHKKNIKKYLR